MEETLADLQNILNDIDALCVPALEKGVEFHQNLKALFDLSIQRCPTLDLGNLMELYVTNLDSESIWEQVQSRNRPLNRYVEQSTKQLHNTVQISLSSHKTMSKGGPYNAAGRGVAIDRGELSGSGTEDSEHEHDDDSEGCEDDDMYSEEEEHEDQSDCSSGEEMESWLDLMDEAQASRLQNKHSTPYNRSANVLNDEDDEENDTEDDEDDEAIARRELYVDDSSGDEACDFKHEDFFRASKRVRVQPGEETTLGGGSVKQKREFEQAESDEGSESGDDDEGASEEDEEEDSEEDKEDALPIAETSYSRKKIALQEQISQLEESAVGSKTWEVAGEVKSSQRPENSLLGIPVDVER
mmetsp:Transcript_298/g.671  ORF Transcript_298/g.671 Transcript_298/m.671 type:complete len:356 (+) Transcript_298:344-1411(+)